MTNNVFAGVIPALMTPCSSKRQPDFDALVRKGTELFQAGMSAVVYCGSMGDWPLLSDEQRMEGTERLVKAGVPVVVGTGAQSPQRAAALAAHASACGAKGLMVIPRVLSRGTSVAAQRSHFEGVLEAAQGLPAVIYNSPYYGFETRADLFFELRKKYQNLIGFKEFGGAASLRYAAEHITGIGNILPKEVLHLVALCRQASQGDAVARARAAQLDTALGVLSSFDEGVDLVLYYKYLMVLAGNPEYELHFNETDSLSLSQRHYAETQLRLFTAWYGSWIESIS